MDKNVEIYLRAPESADVDTLYIWENDATLFESLPNAAPLSRMQVWEYINNYNADPFASRELRLMIIRKTDSALIGYIEMFEFDAINRRAGIGIYIKESERRRGYASAAIYEFEKYAVVTLGMHALWAIVALDNQPSKMLFVNCGFKPSGRLRSWLRRGAEYQDALIYQKLFPL